MINENPSLLFFPIRIFFMLIWIVKWTLKRKAMERERERFYLFLFFFFLFLLFLLRKWSTTNVLNFLKEKVLFISIILYNISKKRSIIYNILCYTKIMYIYICVCVCVCVWSYEFYNKNRINGTKSCTQNIIKYFSIYFL